MKNDKVNMVDNELDEWGLNEEWPDQEIIENENSFSEITNEMTEVNRVLLNRIEEIETRSQQADDAPAVVDTPGDMETLYDMNNDFREDLNDAPELDWQHADIAFDRLPRKNHIMDMK